MDVQKIAQTLGPTYGSLAACLVVAVLMVVGFGKVFGLMRAWYYSVSVGSSVKKQGIGEDWDPKAFAEKYAALKEQGLVR